MNPKEDIYGINRPSVTCYYYMFIKITCLPPPYIF